MSDIPNSKIVLALNSSWQPLNVRTVKEAIVAMLSSDQEVSVALDIHYTQNIDGSWDFDNPVSINPVGWSEWVGLPVREFDMAISSSKMRVRVPTVIICKNFHKMPLKQFKMTKRAVFNRDGWVCQYSGKQLTHSTISLDHINPISKGGGDNWENVVACHIDINLKKGNKSNEEAGLKLLKTPRAPKPLPLSALITTARHASWKPFLMK